MCGSPHGIKVLLSLLTSGEKHLPPHAQALLHPPARTVTVTAASDASTPTPAAAGRATEPSSDVDMQAEQQTAAATSVVTLGASKKDPAARRREVLGSGPGSLAHAVLAHCAEHAATMLRTAQGAELAAEAACGSCHSLWEAAQPQVQALHAAIAAVAACASSDAAGGNEPAATDDAAADKEPLLCDFFASRALRRMAQGSGCNAAAAGAFRLQLWKTALQGRCASVVGTHGAKVLAAVWDGGDAQLRSEIAAELTGSAEVQDVAAWSATFQRASTAPKDATNSKASKRKTTVHVQASA